MVSHPGVDAASDNVPEKTTITVTATDQQVATPPTRPLTVTAVDNMPPVVSESVPDRTVVVGRSIEVDLSKYFSDEDAADRGDTLIYTATSSAVSVATVGTPDDNSVVTITAAATGVAIITVTATDSSDVAASQAFVLRVVANTPPSAAAAIPDQTLVVGENGMVDVVGAFSDPDVAGGGDTLTYTARSSADSVAEAAVAEGSSVVTIAAMTAGTAIIVVTATDSSGATASQTIAVTVNPVVPVVEPRDDGCTIVGTEGDDVLVGTSGDDVICGLGGNDVIRGGAGDDVIRGGAGDDVIRGGAGNDVIRGGAGNDRLVGKAGSDMLFGGPGDDMLRGGPGNDHLRGEAGSDMLFGGPGDDMLRGGSGNDVLRGATGNDTLVGGKGNDVLKGGKG